MLMASAESGRQKPRTSTQTWADSLAAGMQIRQHVSTSTLSSLKENRGALRGRPTTPLEHHQVLAVPRYAARLQVCVLIACRYVMRSEGWNFSLRSGPSHEQRPDAPCLLIFVVSDAVEQLNWHTVVEDLASDVQVGSGCDLRARCRPDRRGLHGNLLSSFTARENAVLILRSRCALADA
jgi:hypothetical protein